MACCDEVIVEDVRVEASKLELELGVETRLELELEELSATLLLEEETG